MKLDICLYSYCSFLGGMSVKVFNLFFNQIVYFLLLSFKNSLYVLDNSLLTDVSFADIFS